MNDYETRLNQIIHHFDEKKNKKLHTDIFIRLCKKVSNEDAEISSQIKHTYTLLSELDNNNDIKPKAYIKSFNLLKKTVRNNLGYTHRGLLQEEYTGIGIAIGVAIGSVFITVNPISIGVGIPIGLAIGASIGRKKENEAEEAGKTY